MKPPARRLETAWQNDTLPEQVRDIERDRRHLDDYGLHIAVTHLLAQYQGFAHLACPALS